MLLLWHQCHFDALGRPERALHKRHDPRSVRVRGTPGPPIGDPTLSVEGREVEPGRHVAHVELDPDAQGRQRPTTDDIAGRVVAEQRQMPGAAPGSDALPYHHGHAQR